LEVGHVVDFSESYLGRLRAQVGHELILCPGAQVVVMRSDESVLFQLRADIGLWEFPSGSAEPGQSFTATAVVELAEETGIRVDESALVPFACLSEPDVLTLRYPNGDLIHAFAMCFLVRDDHATPVVSDGEATDFVWRAPDDPPQALHGPTRAVLRHLHEYLATGAFQVG
jgi:8-oxo-dGTP pyrophosphatase MutT (NUDIX family)